MNILKISVGLHNFDTEEDREKSRQGVQDVVEEIIKKLYGDWFINGRSLYIASFMDDKWRREPYIHPDEVDYGF